jgi:hypothetical protein
MKDDRARNVESSIQRLNWSMKWLPEPGCDERSRGMIRSLLALLLIPTAYAAESIYESFGPEFDAKRFLTPIPNKNTSVRDGVLWTHGSSGGKYPPMVYLPVEGKDLTVSFRYRHLADGGWLWFFVDGEDGFGGEDHMLRVKLLRTGVELQVDGHSKDANHPLRQNSRAPDAQSGAYRLNEILPFDKVDLSTNTWREVKLIFRGENVAISLDGQQWSKSLTRSNFNAGKRKLLWMQNGGAAGIELDDIRVTPAPAK